MKKSLLRCSSHYQAGCAFYANLGVVFGSVYISGLGFCKHIQL